MWQTLIILVVLAAVLIYVVRHYFRVSRAETPGCSGCSGCCGSRPQEKREAGGSEDLRSTL